MMRNNGDSSRDSVSEEAIKVVTNHERNLHPFRIVVIGVSTGGLDLLDRILSTLDRDFPLPVVIVQHRSHEGSEVLVQTLQRDSRIEIVEADDKTPIRAGCVYLAPADYHLLVERDCLALSLEGPVSYARPSIDVLFESAARTFGRRTLGIILTGANRDGVRGACELKAAGGYLVVQDPESADSAILPASAISAAAPDRVLTPPEIIEFLGGVAKAWKMTAS